ncbi:MAG: CCDC90 family protein [Zoogloeaceae bacterium]|jgi:hypothetical protein|nr:CCDC90 family protein [Zoogloeaceae bacterium]
MSYTATFDTLEFAKTLEAEGFQPKQAEGLSKALKQAFQDNGTKLQEELKGSKNELQDELKSAKSELATKGDVLSLKVDMAALEARLIKWMLGAIIGTGGLCAAIASLFATFSR